ncbi:MAG: hypothetical protein VB106_08020 [Clostridiaceae bacterium]|nr:hypothetical protein [Clostridiaceae bacterium]
MEIDGEIASFISGSKSYIDASYYACHCIYPMYRSWDLGDYHVPPYFMQLFCNEVKQFLKKGSITFAEVINLFSEVAPSVGNNSYFFVSQCLLKHGTNLDKDYKAIYCYASAKCSLPPNIKYNEDIFAHAIASYILDFYPHGISDFSILKFEERFIYPITDYKLTKINNIQFEQDGFIFDKKYYLYNRFIDRSRIDNTQNIPSVFSILTKETDFSNADFYLRLDERLAIPLGEFNNSKHKWLEKYYGPDLNFNNPTFKILKTRTVHCDPSSGNQLLLVMKPDFDGKLSVPFWHIELEELPFVSQENTDARVTTTFVHAKYYPDIKMFLHMDYIKNQYLTSEYQKKYIGQTNSGFPVDFYTTKECHYKIWCIENTYISIDTWRKLALVLLHYPYRKLLNEMVKEF